MRLINMLEICLVFWKSELIKNMETLWGAIHLAVFFDKNTFLYSFGICLYDRKILSYDICKKSNFQGHDLIATVAIQCMK